MNNSYKRIEDLTGEEAKERLLKIKRRQVETMKRIYKCYTFRFHKKYDSTIIQTLESKENMADYIRQLILKDIEEEKKGEK